jgi:hypothetical protein
MQGKITAYLLANDLEHMSHENGFSFVSTNNYELVFPLFLSAPTGPIPGLLNECGDVVGGAPSERRTCCNIRRTKTFGVAWHFSSSLCLERFSLPPWRIALELEHVLTEKQTSGEEKLWGRGMRGVY